MHEMKHTSEVAPAFYDPAGRTVEAMIVTRGKIDYTEIQGIA